MATTNIVLVHLLTLVFLLFFSSLWTPHVADWVYVTSGNLSSIGDTLKPGDTLNSTSYLVSQKGAFALGFFRRIDIISNDSYVGISDMADPKSPFNLYVWFGNRGHPFVKDKTGSLTLDNNGTLKIVRQGESPIILYSSGTNNTVATLYDNGNFVLKEVNFDGSTKRVLWQSFDYLMDTLLPGMKLGINHKTGQTWALTSWLTTDIPDYGAFSLEWDPKGLELVIKQRGVVHWKSGVLRNNQFENISPDITSMYDFKVVSNEDEEYFSFSNKNQSVLMSEWIITFLGQFKDLRGPDIGRADNCYSYDTSGGCQGWEQPMCRERGDKFDLTTGYYVNGDILSNNNYSLGISDCKAICWSNCSCVAFTYQFSNETGCRFSTGEKAVQSSQASDFLSLYVLTSRTSHKGAKKWIWIGTVIVAALLVIFFSILCYIQRRRKFVPKGNNVTKDENDLLDLVSLDQSPIVNQIPNDGKKGHDLSVFNYAYVMTATNNFAPQNKLGEGGFGEVYMGELLTGQKIAIKRLSRNSGQGILEFKNELILISKLQHMNLVKLLGFCLHGEERMLIYEYMPNKSLDSFLFDANKSKLLDWQKRFGIIEGVAQGLLYLHKYSRLRVIHRDLKASNILLDENMNPKISDFGMARIFQQNELEANTKRVVGTYGYMSPEYAMEGVFSIKSDVYSFGVLMLEILSGRKNNSFFKTEHLFNLVGYAWELWNEGTALDLMDPALDDSYMDQMLRCVHVGLLCVEDSAIDRPAMSDVLAMLTNDNLSLPSPKKPAFSLARQAIEAHIYDKESECNSINWASISNMIPR
ncbi:G-type lectin S-receptor-like serine/threonine-protein kinase At1g67520 [Quercus robur]|uniref:G-type lectin S-receptor-like serine/threonine-protein kinase At1g67520 n=1 Tax=Quercus robur TaxID=38942 RepID=UPI002162B55B|nr:G-type lectin S-receptor-like serine/threonine-protein kinase At1g67520 [Quercus robur]